MYKRHHKELKHLFFHNLQGNLKNFFKVKGTADIKEFFHQA